MAREMCPACRKPQNMRVLVTERIEKVKASKATPVRTLTYHCETCDRFVRSEDLLLQN